MFSRKAAAWLFALGVLSLEPFAHNALTAFAQHRSTLPCTCIGPADASTQIVYLHGLDTPAPSWLELENRGKLQALANAVHARVAIPRAPGRWPQHAAVDGSVAIIRSAASKCFRRPDHFTLLGFSDGANLVNELFFECRTDVSSDWVSVGSSEGTPPRQARLSSCGRLSLVAGGHERNANTTRILAIQLQKRGAHVRFIGHDGPHELPLRQLLSAFAADHAF